MKRAHPLDRLVPPPAANRARRPLGLARVGNDLALAIVLAASTVALPRRCSGSEVLVAVAAALLLRDAWFNASPPSAGIWQWCEVMHYPEMATSK